MADKWRNIKKRKKEVEALMTPGATVCFFDTETTGIDSEKDRIIQFSGANYKVTNDFNFEIVSALDLYINPERKLPVEYYKNGKVKFSIPELTGITDEMLSDKPTEKQCMPKISSFMSNADVWIAYNSPFDISFLKNASLRTGVYLDYRPTLDALQMSRDLIDDDEVENHKLETITQYLYPEDNTVFHNAFNDVEATVKITKVFIKEYKKLNIEDCEKRTVHLEKAGIYFSQYDWKQRRIKLKLSEGEFGDIFYDCWNRVWSHKSNAKVKKLFNQINLSDLEEQFVNKYGFGKYTFDEIVNNWVKYKEKKLKKENKNVG